MMGLPRMTPKISGMDPQNAPTTRHLRLDEAADAAEAGQVESGMPWGVLMMQLPRFGKNVQIQTDHNHMCILSIIRWG